MKIEPQPWQSSAELVPVIEYGVPENAPRMPFNCQPWRRRAATLVPLFMNGGFPHEPNLEDVRPVEAGERVVPVVHERRIPGQSDPAILIGHVLRLAVGVGALERQTGS